MQVDLQDSGRPAFAYSARLLDKKNRQSISTLGAGSEAVLEVKVRNVGGATAHKGVVILRNETGRQVFLQRGRLDFSELKSQGETQVDLEFDVRDGDPVDHYKFELAIVDSYSGATLVRKLAIEPRDKEDAALFPNGVEFVPPEITAALVDPETRKPVILTGRESLKLEAVIKSRDTDPFKAWIYSSSPSDNDLPPDKIYYIDSRGEPELRIATSVPLKKGLNLFTVVSNDRSGLESRQNIVVRRE
jgi:hypothetical protein